MPSPEIITEQEYVGGELQLFAKARNWKRYWCSQVAPYLRGSVLEVGAGMGTNTILLRNDSQAFWLCLEPDPNLANQLKRKIATLPKTQFCEIKVGTLANLPPTQLFDTILYIDVLEHIQDDSGEMTRAARHLAPGGHLIILSPAHPWLFSEFDRSIGHFRRYTVPMLATLTPSTLHLVKAFYLDSVGLLASGANRFLLGQSLPHPRQIALWDNLMVPCSKLFDRLTFHRLGKSVVAIWTKPL